MNTSVGVLINSEIMDDCLKGVLMHTDKFGWQVRYEFGQSQVKHLMVHSDSIQGVNEFGIEGEEVNFIIRGDSAPNTLNGFISSALLIYKKNPN
jgi:hypothetical protein